MKMLVAQPMKQLKAGLAPIDNAFGRLIEKSANKKGIDSATRNTDILSFCSGALLESTMVV